MHFTDDHGLSLSLAIHGYQFPEATGEPEDDAWLMVSGQVVHPKGHWQFVDPCLTTIELAELADWLDVAAARPASLPTLLFTEPCLTFRYEPSPTPWLEVRLSCECAPPWLVDLASRLDGTPMRFPVVAERMAKAAESARRCLAQFPERQ